MLNFFKKIKKVTKLNRGMTYVELIVVLSIFSVMSSIILFNYSKFQAKVDIKNLANDIALKIVQAQKDAMSGILPSQTPSVNLWKPSYGVYFNLNDDKSFIYFTDLDQNQDYNISSLCPSNIDECIDKINITKGNKISKIESYLSSTPLQTISPLAITFTRPNSGAFFTDSSGIPLTGFDYVQITVSSSDNSVNGYIKIYPSGRIQVN